MKTYFISSLFMGFVLMGGAPINVHAEGGREVGNGGFYLPKNDRGDLIKITLGNEHPNQTEVYQALERLRLPNELKTWIRDDLDTVQIYYSNEIIKKEHLKDGPERGEKDEKGAPIYWFPELIQTPQNTLLAAYTFSSSRVVVYFTDVLKELPLTDQIIIVLHESLHRLGPIWFGELSLDERFVIGFCDFLKRDLTEKISDPDMQTLYDTVFRRFGLLSYVQLPNLFFNNPRHEEVTLPISVESSQDLVDIIIKPLEFFTPYMQLCLGYSAFLKGSLLKYSEFSPHRYEEVTIAYNNKPFLKEMVKRAFEKGLEQIPDNDTKKELREILNKAFFYHNAEGCINLSLWDSQEREQRQNRGHYDRSFYDALWKAIDQPVSGWDPPGVEASKRYDSFMKHLSLELQEIWRVERKTYLEKLNIRPLRNVSATIYYTTIERNESFLNRKLYSNRVKSVVLQPESPQ